MNYIEFGKEMQKISNEFKEITGENLEVVIDEGTGMISSKIYTGTDYPKDRKTFLKFINMKMIKYLKNRK